MTQENVCNVLYGFETCDAMRHVGSVKIAAHGDDVRAAEGQKVLCVREQVFNVRLCRGIVQECFEIVEPTRPPRLQMMRNWSSVRFLGCLQSTLEFECVAMNGRSVFPATS